MSNFGQWKRQALERKFDLKQVDILPELTNWIDIPNLEQPDEFVAHNLKKLRKEVLRKYWDFNEWELVIKVIGRIIQEVNFDGLNVRSFALRELKSTVEGEDMVGKPDLMVASGSQEPESPYFFLQEHKKTFDNEGDPIGQCLAAMLVGQVLNGGIPELMYGGFIVGNSWYFMILKGKEYSISVPYSITDEEDLFKIYQILKTLKIRIFTMLGEELD